MKSDKLDSGSNQSVWFASTEPPEAFKCLYENGKKNKCKMCEILRYCNLSLYFTFFLVHTFLN